MFFSPEYHSPKVVISKECLETQSLSKSVQLGEEFNVRRAESILKDKILAFIEEAPAVSWPPTVDSFSSSTSKIPDPMEVFFKTLLVTKNGHHKDEDTVSRSRFCISYLKRKVLHNQTCLKRTWSSQFDWTKVSDHITGKIRTFDRM